MSPERQLHKIEFKNIHEAISFTFTGALGEIEETGCNPFKKASMREKYLHAWSEWERKNYKPTLDIVSDLSTRWESRARTMIDLTNPQTTVSEQKANYWTNLYALVQSHLSGEEIIDVSRLEELAPEVFPHNYAAAM